MSCQLNSAGGLVQLIITCTWTWGRFHPGCSYFLILFLMVMGLRPAVLPLACRGGSLSASLIRAVIGKTQRVKVRVIDLRSQLKEYSHHIRTRQYHRSPL